MAVPTQRTVYSQEGGYGTLDYTNPVTPPVAEPVAPPVTHPDNPPIVPTVDVPTPTPPVQVVETRPSTLPEPDYYQAPPPATPWSAPAEAVEPVTPGVTNDEILAWGNEAVAEGYDANTYNSRITDLMQRYKDAGVTDDQLRTLMGRNAYNDWVAQIRAGAPTSLTGFDTDMEGVDWNLSQDIPEYQQAEEYDDWTDGELGAWWQTTYDRINDTRNETMEWTDQFQIEPQEVGLLSDRMNELLQNNDDGVSRYIERARSQAESDANAKGMLGSGMSAYGAEAAAIDRAESIAQGDVDVDKFNVGADTAAQTARYAAAGQIGGTAQGAKNAIDQGSADMVYQMLLNKQAHGMEMTVKEQDQINTLQLNFEKQKDALETLAAQQEDLLEGKAADFDYSTQEAANKHYYDTIATKLEFELGSISDAALYEHQAMLKKLESDTLLYQGYIDSVNYIMNSNLEPDAKDAAVLEQRKLFEGARTSASAYGGVTYNGDGINWNEYLKDPANAAIDDPTDDTPAPVDTPPAVDAPPTTGVTVPAGETAQPGDTVEGSFNPQIGDGSYDAAWLLSFQAAYPDEYAQVVAAYESENIGDRSDVQQELWLKNVMNGLELAVKDYSYTQPGEIATAAPPVETPVTTPEPVTTPTQPVNNFGGQGDTPDTGVLGDTGTTPDYNVYTAEDYNRWDIERPEQLTAMTDNMNAYQSYLYNLQREQQDRIISYYVDVYGVASGTPTTPDNAAGSSKTFSDNSGTTEYTAYKAAAPVSEKILVDAYAALTPTEQAKMKDAMVKYTDEHEAWSGVSASELEVGGEAYSWIALQSYLDATT